MTRSLKQCIQALAAVSLVASLTAVAQANLLSNGNLDQTYQQEIVPGFFLPKPAMWVNDGFKSLSGPYEDEMSSESWAGPAPTPVTADGVPPGDWGVFFKPFSGDLGDRANGRLYQDVAATPGVTYQLTGWAGAEANYSGLIPGTQPSSSSACRSSTPAARCWAVRCSTSSPKVWEWPTVNHSTTSRSR